MGDWNKEPWGNDEAADWFFKYWNGGGIDLVISDIKNFSPKDENYDSIRAACLVLECFGCAYAWPCVRSLVGQRSISQAINILTNMISISNEVWGFLDMWNDDVDVIRSVQSQIARLKNYL